MPLDLRYSNSAHYTVETCLLTNVNWILTGIFALIVMTPRTSVVPLRMVKPAFYSAKYGAVMQKCLPPCYT
jgi:uncharacterized membrane protein